jgi:hypothetical protein
MRLFRILTRHVAKGKAKVTKKLIERAQREIGGKPSASPRKSPGKKNRGFDLVLRGAVMATCALMMRIAGARPATGPPSSQTVQLRISNPT